MQGQLTCIRLPNAHQTMNALALVVCIHIPACQRLASDITKECQRLASDIAQSCVRGVRGSTDMHTSRVCVNLDTVVSTDLLWRYVLPEECINSHSFVIQPRRPHGHDSALLPTNCSHPPHPGLAWSSHARTAPPLAHTQAMPGWLATPLRHARTACLCTYRLV